ncbi:tectonin domain-containing protein [Agaribacterium sp. ZY112]|uniref:tectonin domain-containing protein n=1 Tax=Agaribacterium sp. ZY112 TaxID=3233574 RepID=UPI0035260418
MYSNIFSYMTKRARENRTTDALSSSLSNKKWLMLSPLLSAFFLTTQTYAQIPEGPAFVRDTHLIENGEFTRPFQPTVHTSRDGRVGLRTTGSSLSFLLFAPERLDTPFTVSEPGLDNVVSDFHSENTRRFRPPGIGGFRHIGLCEAPPNASTPSNPRVCNGVDDCYDLTIIAAGREGAGEVRFVGIDITVRVENPKTPQAKIAEITNEAPIKGTKFLFKDFFETTTPDDGRIIIGRTAGTRIDWVDDQGNARNTNTDSVYLVNDNPDRFQACDVRQFNKVYPLANAPYDSTINNRYGFAMHPFRDASGRVIADDTSFGSYPWVDRDADNISVTTVRGQLFNPNNGTAPYPTRCPEEVVTTYGSCLADNKSDINSARLQGRIMMGLWTQGKMVQMDNVINNMDFGLGTEERRHRDLKLYESSSEHDGWVRVSGGRNGSTEGGPRPRGSSNINFLDTLEHRFNMFPNMKPVTPSDVPWIISKGAVTDEFVFDDYNNPDSFINSNMVPASHFNGSGNNGNGGGFFEVRSSRRHAVANNATALPNRWSIPKLGAIKNGRVERVANGGIIGRGLWLNTDTTVEYDIPRNTRNVNNTPWYVGLFFDRRYEGGRGNTSRLITFSDGSSLRVRGDGGLQFLNPQGRVIQQMNISGPVQNRARNNGRGWAHVGLNISRGNRSMTVYYNGFYLGRVDANEPIFRMTEGKLYLGATPDAPNDGFKGWIDNFKVIAQNVNQEVACNQANGTLIGVPDTGGWNRLAKSYSAGHFTIRRLVQAAGEPTNEFYACYHDYRDDYRAHMANIPRNHRSVRDAINFPEGPLVYGAPRPDSSNNAFCLSCHSREGRLGMNISALTRNPNLNTEDDPRRQPTQPDAKVYGFIPANWLGQDKPAQDMDAGRDGEDIDQWLFPHASANPGTDGSSSSTYKIADDSTIWKWNGSVFERFGPNNGRLVRIDVGENDKPWGINATGNIYEWNGSRWLQRDSGGQDIAVGRDSVFLTKTDGTIWEWNGSQFIRFGPTNSRLVRIDVGVSRPWGINANGNVYRWDGTRWQPRGSDGQDLGIGGGKIFLTKTDGTIWSWNGNQFVRFGPTNGRLSVIDVGEDGSPWGININGTAYSWNGSRWVNQGGNAEEIGR